MSRPRAGEPRPALPIILTGLCITQIVAWGILYYSFPVLSPRITAATGWSASSITMAFSAGLVLSALLGIPVGRVLDRRGPLLVMTAGSVLAVIALLLIAWSPSFWVFVLGWLLVGISMAGTMYPPAFSAVTRWYGPRRVFALTMITLIGGLASTVFAPLTEALAAALPWQQVYAVHAVIIGAIAIPIHATVLRRPWPRESTISSSSGPSTADAEASEPAVAEEVYAHRVLRSPAYVFTTIGMTLGSIAMWAAVINLIPMLVERGISSSLAAWVLALGGVGQVLGRLFYWAMERGMSVRARTLVIFGIIAVSTGALAVDITHALWLIVISVGAGVGRGISTLLKATAVTDRWGPRAYGRLSGVLNAPTTLAIAVAPGLGALTADLLGSYEAMYLVMAGVGAAGVVALIFSIPKTENPDAGA